MHLFVFCKFKVGKVNLTLQTLLEYVVKSLNDLSDHGLHISQCGNYVDASDLNAPCSDSAKILI